MTRYPFFFLILFPLPALILLAANIDQVSIKDGSRLLAISILLAIPFYILLFRKGPFKWFKWLNIFSLVMLIYPAYAILPLAIPRDITRRSAHSVKGDNNSPDIYFIVLDSYSGHKVLLERFNYDNSAFLEELRSLGFRVSDCTSPGDITDISLAATMNGELPTTTGPELWRSIRESRLRLTLEARGYKTIGLATGFIWDQLTDADIYLTPPPNGSLNEFEWFYLKQIGLAKLIPQINDNWGLRYRERTLYGLEMLPTIAKDPAAKFTFAHFVIPHPPFVFNANGSQADWASLRNDDYLEKGEPEYSLSDYAKGYTSQLTYIDRELIPMLRQILTNSARPPVIILEGDHGAWYPENEYQARSILCAIYGPEYIPLEPLHYFDFVWR